MQLSRPSRNGAGPSPPASPPPPLVRAPLRCVAQPLALPCLPAPRCNGMTCASGPHRPPQAVVLFHGDRVPPPAGPLAARLQQPDQVAALLASKFPGCSAAV